jgi:hypothetical protein
LRFYRLNTLRAVEIDGHTANDNPHALFFRDTDERFYIRAQIPRAKVSFAGHSVFVKRIAYRNAYSSVAYIKGNGSLFNHSYIITQFPPFVYRFINTFCLYPHRKNISTHTFYTQKCFLAQIRRLYMEKFIAGLLLGGIGGMLVVANNYKVRSLVKKGQDEVTEKFDKMLDEKMAELENKKKKPAESK